MAELRLSESELDHVRELRQQASEVVGEQYSEDAILHIVLGKTRPTIAQGDGGPTAAEVNITGVQFLLIGVVVFLGAWAVFGGDD